MGLFKDFKASIDNAGASTERAAQMPGGVQAAELGRDSPST